MKTVLLSAIVLCVASTAAAQTANPSPQVAGDCKLTLSESPALQGIRLGMTVDQALDVFPKNSRGPLVRTESPRYGFHTVGVDPQNTEDKENSSGVRYINLGFLDGELSFFTIVYYGPEWNNEEQFASQVADTLNLPGSDFWKTIGGSKVLNCDGFQISVQLNSGNTIELRNTERDAAKIVAQREKEAKQETRRALKP